MKQKLTKSQKSSEVARDWYIIDASSDTLGRIAVQVANKLIGKEKATYTPHVDGGDYVIVTNSDKIRVTGRKLLQKKYYSHSGYIGNLKEATLGDAMESDSRVVIERAVKGMLPKNKLLPSRLARLKVYKDEAHNHEAQKPKALVEKK